MITTTDTTVVGAGEFRLALADDASFRAWYDRALPRVFGYVSARTAGDPALAEEITQQAFIAAIDERARFDGRSDSVTWVCAIARNKLADHFRRRGREDKRHERVVVREIHLDESRQQVAWSQSEQRELVVTALRSLPALQRAVLTFVALDGLSVPEVARLMGKSTTATQSLLARARDGFRRAWAREQGDD
jgi:RNA polymerase sigma-70 factor, ECF subfamily